MKYDPSIHHRRSIRLQGYDYAQAGAYFVTICTYQKVCIFGEIRNGVMVPNELGIVTLTTWQRIPARFPGIAIGPFSLMPNHHHGVLRLAGAADVPGVGAGQKGDANSCIPLFAPPLPHPLGLGVVVNQFKSTAARIINGLRHTPGEPVWQRNYYEHIIRDETDYERISEYILANPLIWDKDEYFPN